MLKEGRLRVEAHELSKALALRVLVFLFPNWDLQNTAGKAKLLGLTQRTHSLLSTWKKEAPLQGQAAKMKVCK